MGLCATHEEELAMDAPSLIQSINFGPIQVQLIHGYYKLLRAEYLISILQLDNAIKNNILTESISCPKDVIASMIQSKKTIETTNCPKGLGFKKIITCLLPNYNSLTTQEYISLYENLLKEIFKKGKSFMIVFKPSDEINNLPNQMLISLLLSHLSKKQNHGKVQKIQLVSQQKNICNLFRLEVQKAHSSLSQSMLLEISK